MTIAKLDQLEDRIQKPGYLLFLVVVLLFLIIGLVDMIDQTSRDPVVFGRYSVRYTLLLVAYAAVVVAWASLLLRPNNDHWLRRTLDFIQYRPLLAVTILAGFLAMNVAMIVPGQQFHNQALDFPALQVTLFVLSLLFGGLILFYRWGDASRPNLWRKVIVSALLFFLAVELVLQAMTLIRVLPSLNTPVDSFDPYSRVYQNEEGFTNGIANRFGRYTPEFALQPDSRRIAIVGDSFIQAIQVGKDDNLGVVLQEMLQSASFNGPPTEILTLGYPEVGPGLYLSNWKLDVVASEFEPEEMMVFFDLGSDFQIVDGPGYGIPYYTYAGQGRVNIDLEDFWGDLHKLEHEVYYGHEGFKFTRLIGSHYLTPRVVSNLIAGPLVKADQAFNHPSEDIDLPNGFMFNEATNGEAMLVAKGLLQMAQEQLGRAGVRLSMVTIPVFTDAFYEQSSWNTVFGSSDLLLPEREMRRSAQLNNRPFLGLGTYMEAKGMTPEEVRTLYFKDGRGNFTPAGHALAAQAVYDCFFAQTLTAEEGCDRR
jgi:uncharacterized membrane protein